MIQVREVEIKMKEFKIGDKGEFSKTITETDVYLFAGICGDFNPIHVNRIEAQNSFFGRPIVHGALVTSFISTVLGMYMPGPGSIYMEQKTTFLHPVFIGDTVIAKVEITDITEKNIALLETKIYNQENQIVVDGYAKIKLPR